MSQWHACRARAQYMIQQHIRSTNFPLQAKNSHRVLTYHPQTYVSVGQRTGKAFQKGASCSHAEVGNIPIGIYILGSLRHVTKNVPWGVVTDHIRPYVATSGQLHVNEASSPTTAGQQVQQHCVLELLRSRGCEEEATPGWRRGSLGRRVQTRAPA